MRDMLTTIFASTGEQLRAKVEVEDDAIVVHSRGGAFGKSNLRNPDYRKALQAILQRLRRGGIQLSGVWLDSSVAKQWPESERLLLDAAEFTSSVDEVIALISKRGAAKGRADGVAGHGNSTKRIRIGVSGISQRALQQLITSDAPVHNHKIPAEVLRRVTPTMIDDAVAVFQAGANHNFQDSKDYDLLLPTGERLPPKAVFGIALSNIINRPATPGDFAAGRGEVCFELIEEAGYPIVSKEEDISSTTPDADDERSWAEGSLKRVEHLRKERAPGLSRTKKRWFIEKHGHLFCERCGIVPSQSLGPFGDACIEVHHNALAVAKMNDGTRTRLADLMCLCANCHRIVHREQL